MRIRQFRKDDARQVSNIIRKCLKEVNSKYYPKKVIVYMCNFFSPSKLLEHSKNRTIFVAVENNKIVGTASLKESTILTVFVDPTIHKKGIGTKLMDKIETLAKKKGYKTAELQASLNSSEFYKKRGYKNVKKVYSEGFGHSIKMKKKL
jgi:N-acetylglutamate synthase-like GNAT family acetyltransferase